MYGILVNELIPAGARAKMAKEVDVRGKVTVGDYVPPEAAGQNITARYVRARTRAIASAEGTGGLRVSDAAGDVHGLVANNIHLITNELGERSVELQLDSSKTGDCRTVNMAGTTLGSQTPTFEIMRECITLSDLPTVEWQEGAHIILRPAASVVRVYIGGISTEDTSVQLEFLLEKLAASGMPEVVAHIANTRFYAKLRNRVLTNEKKAYVNVMIARDEDPRLQELVDYLAKYGFSCVSIAPAPMFRATRGASITLMPLQENSTYENMIDLLPIAERISLQRGDPDFDLEGRAKSTYGNHSLRQMADHVARKTMDQTGSSETDIDRMFGWNENYYKKRMQLHYAGRAARVRRAKITSFT